MEVKSGKAKLFVQAQEATSPAAKESEAKQVLKDPVATVAAKKST